jgi:hypothetical protein
MKGIYLTPKGKQELEAKIAELEKNRFACLRLDLEVYKEILSSATVLAVEESWSDLPLSFWFRDGAARIHPNGVIIQPQ